MIWGYLHENHKFHSVETQKKLISEFAQKYQFKLLRFRLVKDIKNIFYSDLQDEDTVIVSDVSLFGSRFEEIISAFKILSNKRIRICCASEDLMFDNLVPHLSYGLLDSCLKIYKGTLSIKNKRIQAKLLECGRNRGRPKNKTLLDENFEELKQLLKTDLTITEIAKQMNINRTTLFAFMRRKNLNRQEIQNA